MNHKMKKIFDEYDREIKNGDIFDIGQTVNGISKFIILVSDDIKIHYLNHDGTFGREYEYDQNDLLNTIANISGLDDVNYIGNYFE